MNCVLIFLFTRNDHAVGWLHVKMFLASNVNRSSHSPSFIDCNLWNFFVRYWLISFTTIHLLILKICISQLLLKSCSVQGCQICLFWQTIATFLGVSGGFKLIHSSSNPRSCLYDPTAILTAEGMPTANSKGGSPIPFEENTAHDPPPGIYLDDHVRRAKC